MNAKRTWSEPGVNVAWLAKRHEEAIEPDMPIIDPHHHLWEMPNQRYLLPEYLQDIRSGHRIEATIYVEASMGYRTSGPADLRPVGETEFALKAAVATDGLVAAGIVAYANLRMGEGLDSVLAAHKEAGQGRVRGVRDIAAWHPDIALQDPRIDPPENTLDLPEFRSGVRSLGTHGLVFDVWLYFNQLQKLVEVARAAPETRIVVDHTGGPLGLGEYSGRRDAVFQVWQAGVKALSACPNVHMKLGGMGMRWMGFGFHERETPPSSQDLATAWRPYFETAIEAFGASHCMFESNFPVDGEICSYVTLWNAYKRIAEPCSAAEKDALFRGTALNVYGIKTRNLS